MQVFKTGKDLEQYTNTLKNPDFSLGFVPTMGALHEGHLSLIKQALDKNSFAVVSIFVNPTQFDNAEDLTKYPRTLDQDLDLLKTLSDNIIVYAPSVGDIYKDSIASKHFDFNGLEHEMEGKFRDGHFDGVGTVVKKLLKIVKPDNAYFGEKDFQQLQIIKTLVEKYQIPVKIIGCEIHREPNGFAMSSRNERLSSSARKDAGFIYKMLKEAKEKFGTKSANEVVKWVEKQFSNHRSLTLEYFTIADETTLKPIKRKNKQKKYRAFIAVYVENIRLIDNIALN
jgi:pantoate--beta-alanine ligase